MLKFIQNNLNLNAISIFWGFLSGLILIGVTIKIDPKKIIDEAGTFKMFDPIKIIKTI